MKSTLTRILSLVLALCLTVGLLPASAIAAFGEGKHSTVYDETVVEALTEATGSEESAIGILDQLYSAGLIDENGQYVENPTFVVNGEEVATDVLLEMATQHDADEEVTVDGETTTWGTLSEYIQAASDLATLLELQSSEAQLTEEHLGTLRSLLENLSTGIAMGDDVQLADLSEHKTWPATAVKEIELNVQSGASGNYIQVPGFGDSGYDAGYSFYMASQNSTAAYTDSRYDGSGISHSARVGLTFDQSKLSVPASTTTDQTITVTASLTIAQPVAVSFEYRATAGSWSAVEGSGTVTWAAGETGDKTFDITVKATEKNTYNGYKCFFIQCYNIQNALFADDKTVVDQQINVTCDTQIASASGVVPYYTVVDGPTDGTNSDACDLGEHTYTNQKYTFTLPQIPESAWDVKLTWTLNISYRMAHLNNLNCTEASNGYHNMNFYCNSIGLNYNDNHTFSLKNGAFNVYTNVNGSAYGKDISGSTVTITRNAHSCSCTGNGNTYYCTVGFSRDMPTNGSGGLETNYYVPGTYRYAYNRFTFTYQDLMSQVSVEKVSIPDGKFYPGQVVPIAVTYDYYLYSGQGDNMSITVNGDVLNPVEVGTDNGTLSNTFTYLYTVKELDSGTIGISSFNFGTQQKGLNFTGSNYLSMKGQDYTKITGIKNADCSLQTPQKMSSFTAFQVGCDDADPAQQTVIVNLPIDATMEGGNYPYIAWIAANQAYDATGTTVKLGDGTEKEVHFYVKSMYVSNDGGATRYPLWIVTESGAITLTKPDGSQYQSSEFPTNLVANMAPAENPTADFRVDTVEIFVDPEIDSATDYLVHEKNTFKKDSLDNVYYVAGEDAPAAGVAIGYAYPVYVKGVVLLENGYTYTEGGVTRTDGQDVTISYSDEWCKGLDASTKTTTIKGKASPLDETEGTEMTRKVYEYYVQNEQDMLLEYVVHDRYNEGSTGKQAAEYYGHADFTFQSYKWMQWASSDESIATVDETGYVTFTGKTGDVYFILTPLNGGNTNVQYYLYSDVVRVKAGLTPFLQINKVNRDKVVLEDTDATVYFTSNVAERNQAENGDSYKTTITGKMYAMSDVSYDGKTVDTGSAVPVWTGSVTSPVATEVYSDEAGGYVTEYVPKNGITIPGEKITKIADGSDKDYVVIVSAEFQKADGSTSQVSAFATLQVKPSPAKPKLGKLNSETGAIEKLDSYFVLSDAIPAISYQIKNAKSGTQAYYTIKDSGTLDYKSELLTDLSGTIPAVAFSSKPDGLKNIYTVSLYARNSEEDEWTVDSMTLNVYNADALQLVVTAANSMELGGTTGGKADSSKNLIEDGKVSFEKLSLVQALLDGSERQIDIDGTEVTLEMLQNDISLQYIVSINYGDYAWGMLSDQIAWKSSDHTVASLNYYQGGYYSDVESYSYPSYLPATDLVGMGLKEGTTVFTATHVQNGQSVSVQVDVSRLENQFYLFQFQPKGTVNVTYTNGSGEEIKLKTNEQGQLAVYEPTGIAGDVLATADIGSKTYAGVIKQEDLLSGEQDLTALVTYPVNNLKMRLVSEVYIYVKNPDGTPAADMNITLRGGVYKNSEYCPDARFGTSASGYVINQNGRADFTGTTDSTGKLTIKMDTTQFLTSDPEDIPMVPGDTITYLFELRAGDGTTYAPDLIKITTVTGDDLESGFATSETYQLQKFDSAAGTPVLVHQYFQMYSSAVNPDTLETYLSPVSYADDVINETGAVGPSLNYHTAVLDSTVMYWTDPVTATDENGYAKLPSTISDSDRVVLKDMDNEELPGQISTKNRTEAVTNLNDCSGLSDLSMYVYPFSSMAIGRNAFRMDVDSFAYNSATQNYDYLPQYESMGLQMDIIRGGKTVSNAVMPFSIINMLGAADPMDSIDVMISQVRKQLAESSSVGDMMKNVTDVINPVLEVPFTLISDVMFDSGVSKMYARIYPSNDPTVYRILIADIFDGDEVAFDNSSKVNIVSEVIEKKQAQEKENADVWYSKVMAGYNKSRQSFGFALEGYQILEAKCDKNGNWTVRPVAGHIFAQLPDITILSWTTNFLVGPVPAFVTWGIGFGLNMGYDYTERSGSMDRLVKNTLRVYFDLGGGIGAGDLAGVITLKLGLFFKMGLNIEFLRLFSENIYDDKSDYFGTGLVFNGEFSIRFEVGVGPLSYTHNFLRVGYTLPAIGTGYYDAIVAYNKSGNPNDFKAISGYTLQGDEYQIMGVDEDGITLDISSARLDDRDYLERGNRAWYDDSQDMSLQELYSDAENYAKVLQTNAYPKAYPVYTDDGLGMFYLTDLNVGTEAISAVAFADRRSGSTLDQGPIESYHYYVRGNCTYYAKDYAGEYQAKGRTEADSEIELVEYNAADNYILFKFLSGDDTTTEFKMTEVANVSRNKIYVKVTTDTACDAYQTGVEIDAVDYNAFDLVASGSGKEYFAAWVRQTEALQKEMGAAATNDDLGLAMNAGEIVVASGDGKTWNLTQLTEDGVSDMNPQIASSGEKAIVVWQRVGSSSDPTRFDISNDVVYSCYDGKEWSEVRTAYSCVDGDVEGLDVAMMEDGTALISYCVNCADDSAAGDDGNNVEAFCAVVDDIPAGTVTKTAPTAVTRLSCNTKSDTAPHAVVVKDSAGTQQFLMTWLETEEYEDSSVSGEGTATRNNLRLALIDADGKQDPGFVESIAANDNLTINDSYLLMTSADQKLENTHVMWKTTVSETDGEDEEHVYDVLMASKFYADGDTEGLTAQREVARLKDNVMVDHFDGYVDETGCVQAVLFASDYNSPMADGLASIQLQGADEPVQAVLTSPESQMYTAYCRIPDSGFTVSAPTYSLSEMEPGYESPLYFSFTNAGAQKLASATITVDGSQSKTYTFSNGGLLPGESVNLTFNYTVPMENVHDVEYAVTASCAGELSQMAEWLDKGDTLIAINCPDIGITSFAVTSEGDAQRELTVGLKNSSKMPLEGSGKILQIAFYRDADMTEQIGTTQTISGSYYGLIDNNACTYRTTFTAEQLAELVKDDVTGQLELPTGEINVYTKVWLLNEDESAFTETVESNNTAYTSFTGLLDRYRDLSLTETEDLMVSGISSKEQAGDVLADVTLQNLSLGTRTEAAGNRIGNVRVTAYNEEGTQIGQADTFDFSNPSTDYYKSVSTEGKLNVQPKLTLTDSYEAADIADWEVTLFEDSYEMLYTWDNVVEPGADRVEIPSGMFAQEAMRTIGDYTYAGYDVDYGYTTSLTQEPTQGSLQFVGWYEVLGYNDGTEDHLVGANGFTAEELAKIDFIAHPDYYRILAYNAYDFGTQLQKDTVLYALFTAMMVVDPDDTSAPLPAAKAVSITGRTDNALTDEIYLTLELMGDTFTDELECGVEWETNVPGVKVKVVEILPNNTKDNNVIRVQVFGEATTGFVGNLVIRPTTADSKYFNIGIPVSSVSSGNLTIDIKAFFQIHHTLEGMEGNEEKETTVGYMTVGSALDPAVFQNSYTGYTYVSGTTGKEVQADKSSEITLKYNRNDYTIRYNGGSLAVDPETGDEIGEITGSTADTKAKYDVIASLNDCGYSYAGYRFAGWNTKADGTGISYAASAQVQNLASSGEVTLYAQWVADGTASYQIAYYFQTVTDGVASYECRDIETVAGVQAGATVTVGAKSFTGYVFSAGNRLNVTGGVVDEDLTLKLYYDLPKVMVNFRATGAQGGSTGMYTPDVEVTVPGAAELVREGYTLSSWNTRADGTGTTLELTKMGYVADSNGEYVRNAAGDYELATRETRNQKHYTYTTVSNTFCAPEEDTTYYAIWTKNSYTVTFDANAAEEDAVAFSSDLGYTQEGKTLVRTVAYGEAILAPEVTREVEGVKQTFLGWYDSTDPETARPVSKVAESGDVTYYAIWAAPYTVKRLYQDVDSVGAAEPVWDDAATTTEIMWGEPGAMTEAVATPAEGFLASPITQQVIGENTVVEVRYMRGSYNVFFQYNGGELVDPAQAYSSGKLTYDTPITAPVLQREGYTFVGWSQLVSERVPAETVIYTAQWVEKPYLVSGEISNLTVGGTLVVDLKRNDTVVATRTIENITSATETVDFGACAEGIYQLAATLYTADGSCRMTEVLAADAVIAKEESSKAVSFAMTMPAIQQNAAVAVKDFDTVIGVSGMDAILNDNLNQGENVTVTLEISGLAYDKDPELIRRLASDDGKVYAMSFDLTLSKYTQTLNLDGEVVAETDTRITDTNGQYIELAIPFRDSNVTVYRVHNGLAEVVGSELSRRYADEPAPHEGWYYDAESEMLYIYVNRFSTFVIGKPDGTSGSDKGSGSTGSTGSTTGSSTGTGTSKTQKQVNISTEIENGTVELLSKSADEALVKVTADAGYVLDRLTVTDEAGNAHAAEQVEEGSYRIALADVDVTVSASFRIRFLDVSEEDYYADAVVWAYRENITTGTDAAQTVFAPNGITTRAQMVTFLWRAAGSPEPAATTCKFTDVATGAYYYKAVLWAVEKGITSGTSDTTFSPDAVCTRAQTVTFLWRYEGGIMFANMTANGPAPSLFTDVATDVYYYNAVLWAKAQGITTGTSDTTFAPDDNCTRAQVVCFLYRDIVK